MKKCMSIEKINYNKNLTVRPLLLYTLLINKNNIEKIYMSFEYFREIIEKKILLKQKLKIDKN